MSSRFVTPRRRRSALALVLIAALGAAASASAQVIAWSGGTGLWTNGGNWSGEVEPGPSNTASIASGVATLNASRTISGLTMSSTGGLVLADGAILTLQNNGTLTGTSSMTLSSTGSTTRFRLVGTLTVDTSASITMGNNANNILSGHEGVGSLVNQGTISGAGQIGAGGMTITNSGTITANQAAGLVIDPSFNGLTNTGTLRATSGATLTLQDSNVGVGYTNTGGNITAENASFVELNSLLAFSGGNITTTGTGTVRINGSFLGNVAINNGAGGTIQVFGSENAIYGSYNGASGSTLRISDGATLNIGGGTTMTVNGNIIVGANENTTTLRFEAPSTTLNGTGTITLEAGANPSEGRSRIRGGESSLTIGSGFTIQGAGILGGSSLNITNQGTVDANVGAATIYIDLDFSTLTNTGLLRARDAGTLTLFGGTVMNAGGTITSQDTTHIDLIGTTIIGGTLNSTGSGHYHARMNESVSTMLSGVTIGSGTGIEVDDGSSLILSGTITNNGLIQLLGFETPTQLIMDSGGVTLTGNGHLSIADYSQNIVTGTGSVINESSHTIKGAGQLGQGFLTIDNRGTIKADIPGATMIISPQMSGTGLLNSGDIKGVDGGIVRIQNASISQTSTGSIFSNNGGLVQFGNVTVQGGSLGGSITLLSGSTIRALEIDPLSVVQIANNTSLTIGGTIQNGGIVQLNATSGGNAHLIVEAAGATLTGGVVQLGDDSGNMITGVATTTPLVNVGIIRGGGHVGGSSLTLTNNGTIEASSATTSLRVNVTNSGGWTNHGTLLATSGNLIVEHSFTNAGVISVQSGRTFQTNGNLTHSSGLISLNSGTLTGVSLQTSNSSILTGSGTISGTVSASGTVAPGASGSSAGIGTLTFTSTVTFAPTSMLLLDLAGTTVGSYDRILGTGTINVNSASTLGITFSGGFGSSVTSGDSFTLLSTTGTLNGTTFANVSAGRVNTLDGIGSFAVTFAGNAVTISNFQVIPEPSTYALMGLGAVAVIGAGLRRRRR